MILETGSELDGNYRITYAVEEDSANNVYYYSKNDSEYEKTLLGEGVTENYYPLGGMTFNDATLEDIVSCELLENGNYEISFVHFSESGEPEDEITYCNYMFIEISKEGMFISQNISVAEVNLNKDGTITERFGGTVTYEYGVVQESDYAYMLAEAKDAEVNA